MANNTAFQPSAFQFDAFQIVERPVKVSARGAALGRTTVNAAPVLNIQSRGSTALGKVR